MDALPAKDRPQSAPMRRLAGKRPTATKSKHEKNLTAKTRRLDGKGSPEYAFKQTEEARAGETSKEEASARRSPSFVAVIAK